MDKLDTSQEKDFLSPRSKLLYHSTQTEEFIRQGRTNCPVNVEIAPTNFCNATCPWCFYVSSDYKQRHSKEWIEWDTLHSALIGMAIMGVKAISWTGGGEPSVYPEINKAIDVVHTLGMKQGLFTNGYKAIDKPEQLDWIRITITDRFTIPKSTTFYASKTTPGANLNLIAETKESEVNALVQQAKDAGAHYFQIRPALADTYDKQGEIKKPTISITDFPVYLTEYKFDDYYKPHGYPICYGHNYVPFVWHNGDVSVCAYHFGRDPYNFGNLYKKSFQQIWNGDRRKKMLEAGIPVIPMCQHCCKNHEINKVLYGLKQIKDTDFV